MKYKDLAHITPHALVEMFCEKYEQSDWFFIGDVPYGVVNIGDYYLSMDDIAHALVEDVKWEDLFDWYWWSLEDFSKYNGSTINLKSWAMGLRPVYIKKETDNSGIDLWGIRDWKLERINHHDHIYATLALAEDVAPKLGIYMGLIQ